MRSRLTPRHANLNRLTPSSRRVEFRVLFSGRWPNARVAVERRLTYQLRRIDVSCEVTQDLVVLAHDHGVTPVIWLAVFGWLYQQPEVILVARLWPLTRRWP